MEQTTLIFKDEDMLNKQHSAYCLLLSVAMGAGKEDQDWIENERSFEKKGKYQIIIPTTRRI